MTNRIILTDANGQTGRVVFEGGEFSGLLPPLSGEFLPVYERLIAEGVVPEEYTAPASPAPLSITKLGLKRALAETGPLAVFPDPEWAAVKALIASDPEVQEEWDLATEIQRADPLVAGMIAARGYAPEKVDAIMIRATQLV